MSTPRSTALRSAAAARSVAAEQRARHAIAELDRRGQPITFRAAAAEAGVSARALRPPAAARHDPAAPRRATQHPVAAAPAPARKRRIDPRTAARRTRGEQATPCRERAATRRARARPRRDPRTQARKPPPEHAVSEWPAPVGEQALHGPAGEFVLRTEPHSEAHPMALLSSSWSLSGARAAAARTTRSRPIASLHQRVRRAGRPDSGTWTHMLRATYASLCCPPTYVALTRHVVVDGGDRVRRRNIFRAVRGSRGTRAVGRAGGSVRA